MDLRAADGVALRFHAYIEHLSEAMGHADRHAPLAEYCTGLLLPGERKSVEPMAARVAPAAVGAKHQSLHHFVAKAPWDETELLASVRAFVLPIMEKTAPVRAWIVDDTGIPKKGKHSVGVARQYCGELGKQDNCQVAVSLSVASDHASLPIALRLYLPEAWAGDQARREHAGVPGEIAFATKPSIALEQIRQAIDDGVPQGVVLADAGYGNDTAFRTELTAMGLAYAVGVQGSTAIWAPGRAPLPKKKWSGKGRPTKRLQRDDETKPVSAKALAESLPKRAWKTVEWREGAKGALTSRFARVRVRPSHRDTLRAEPWPEQWLLIEWPEGEAAPTKYWLSTMPADTPLAELVDTAKLRWRIERDFQDLKQEIGLDHYEGRGWRGFHHHAALSIAAYGFLLAERSPIPPSAVVIQALARKLPPHEKNFRRRGAAAA
ncbi:MAG TPA: IS701 family transposase [Burkholderiales bacterium]|nr:IS701 family transposase [Burkholderiales bacterium]